LSAVLSFYSTNFDSSISHMSALQPVVLTCQTSVFKRTLAAVVRCWIR